MENNITKFKNQKVIYEQRREKVWKTINEINDTESKVSHYNRIKKQNGILVGIVIFILSLPLFKSIINYDALPIFLSFSSGILYITTCNIINLHRLKKIKETNPNIDFTNFNFEDSFNKKKEYINEIDKIDELIFVIENKIKSTINVENSHQINNRTETKEKIKVKKLGGIK